MNESKAETSTAPIQAKATSFKSNIYANVSSKSDLNDSHLAKDISTNNLHDYYYFGVTGNATVNANDVKKGNKILLGQYFFNNNYNSDLPIFLQQTNSIDGTSKDYGLIGQVSFEKQNDHTINAYLTVKSDKDFTGQVNVSYQSPSFIWVNDKGLIYQFKGITHNKPLIENISSSNGNSFKITYNFKDYDENPINNYRGTYAWMHSPIGEFGYGSSAFFDPTSNSGNQRISSNQTQPYSMNNFHRVLQLTGDNLPKDITGFNGRYNDRYIQVFDANGIATNEILPVGSVDNQITQMADYLTPQQLYDQTPINKVGFSKQQDGSWLVCYNISPSFLKMSKSDIAYSVSNYSILANIQDPGHKQQIIDNTVKVYNDLLGGMPTNNCMGLAINNVPGADTSLVEHDVTPGSTQQINGSGYLSLATGDANAQLQSRISYQFVDDDNNGLAVGQPVTLTGKAGDVVNPHLSVPVGYELAPGQSLPGNYTLKDSNEPVIIHLKHKTGSAVINTPASQADEDTSSTPATKASDDSNEQKDQSINNQQGPATNDSDHKQDSSQSQNKDDKNHSDQAALPEKKNKSDSDNDDQADTSVQPQKVLVKAAKNDAPIPAVTQSQAQLPQTDSQGDKALLGVAALTGSFAAMFAMSKRRKED